VVTRTERSAVLRPALPSDWPRIWPIWRHVIDEGRTYPWAPGTAEAVARRVWMDDPDETWVIEEPQNPAAGRVVATAILEPNQPGIGSHVAHCGFMVEPPARGRGFGRMLVEGMLQRAADVGYTAMQFNAVVADNPAVRLYERLGFRVVGRIPQGFERASGPVDLLVMHRFLEVQRSLSSRQRRRQG
jgi:RimJ/RimL family protein N-acetyltransferase